MPVVLGSGSLGLISIPGEPRRLTQEEIDDRYPRLISGLAAHPEIGFVLVRRSSGSSVVLGPHGSLDLATGEVVGDDPLAPFGPRARAQVAEVDGYATVADLMVNSRYDPDLEEVAAFEDQVSSHGGLGGPQTHPFLLYPSELSAPIEPIFTSPAMHKVLKGWLAEVGRSGVVVTAESPAQQRRRAVTASARTVEPPLRLLTTIRRATQRLTRRAPLRTLGPGLSDPGGMVEWPAATSRRAPLGASRPTHPSGQTAQLGSPPTANRLRT